MSSKIEEQLSELLLRSQAGDPAAYREFLSASRAFLSSVLRSQAVATSNVDDILQETLIAVHHYRHTYDPRRPVTPWLKAIALNRARDVGRARKRHREYLNLELGSVEAEHSSRDQDVSESMFVRALLNLLSDAQREVIWLLKFEGYSVAEIAGRTGRSQSSVKVTAHRGYQALKAWFKAQ